MMLKKLVLPTAIITAFAFTPVMANQSGDTGGSKAERQQEMQTGTGANAGTQSFDDLDRNQDGQLDEDELNTWGSTAAGGSDQENSQRGEQMMRQYDRDESGSVSQDEFDRGLNEGTGTGTGSGAEAGANQ